MVRRKKLWLVLILIVGLAIGGAAGYYAHAKVYAPKKTKAAVPAKTASSSSAVSSQPAKAAVSSPADIEKVRQVMSFLSANIGPRPGGKAGERQAASYLASELQKMGYSVGMDQFPLPSGSTSQNLITADPGQSSDYTFFVCAHMDTVSGSPGANDNASGCAALLELARTIKGTKHYPEVRFLIFGAEEQNSSGTARVGSRYYLGTQPAKERAKIIGVVSLDTIALGPEVKFRDWGPKSPALADALVKYAAGKGINGARLQGQGSDHEPFGDAGIPAVWLERMVGGQPDPNIHTSSDTMDHATPNLAAESADFVRNYLLSLDKAACKAMATAAHAPAPGSQSSAQ